MIREINKRLLRRFAPRNDKKGQTALILILLSAAALVFMGITLNWGRIAQTKSLLSVAADQAASQLASDTASYGEMQKQTYLKDTNQIKASNGIILAIIMVIVTIVLTIVSWGTATPFMIMMDVVMVAASVMSVVNLALQLAVVQPGITALWNKLQKNQPTQQQFFEGGVAAALQSSVTDQVKITDYFDANANGIMGNNASGFPNDSVGRFAVYYTDRLKMLNQAPIPQVKFFYDQLGEFINGETCGQSQSDNYNYGIAVNQGCQNAGVLPFIGGSTSGINCITDPIDPVCEAKIPAPDGFQLNDACAGYDPTNTATYSPYCDPCCQPQYLPGSSPPKALRPSSCTSGDSNCSINNPYGLNNLDIYDPSFQNYASQLSFLDQFGRDQQLGPPVSTFASMTPNVITPNPTGPIPVVEFPNGIYPFFWEMDPDEFSPEVDAINPMINPLSSNSPALHWCAPATAVVNGVSIPSYTYPTGFPVLGQLNLTNTTSYSCQGPDCCVNFLADTVGSIGGISTPITDGTAKGTANGAIDMVGSPTFQYNPPLYNPTLDPSFGDGASVPNAWLPGDNQMCLVTWPYNGSSSTGAVDGTCEWTGNASMPPPKAAPSPAGAMTADSLDDTMHTLSDFVEFANVFLSNDVGTLSSTFQTWYPQAAGWVSPACDDGAADICGGGGNHPGQCSDGTTCGRLLSIYNPYTNYDLLSQWDTELTKWLANTYVSANAWCVPPQNSTSLYAIVGGVSVPTAENSYITSKLAPTICPGGITCPVSGVCSDGSKCSSWGDLNHVIQCLNYNSNEANGSVNNYSLCLAALNAKTCPAVTSSIFTPGGNGVCDPVILGRSLAGAAPAKFNGNCNTTIPNSYAKWVSDSYTLANDEAPKFTQRSAFLTDVQNRAQSMLPIFAQGDTALQNFFCLPGSSNCPAAGGPAAQLVSIAPCDDGSSCTHNQCADGTACVPSPSSSLPNAVIYGWQDATPTGGSGGCTGADGVTRVGCSHIVKVTAYSTDRCGGSCSASFIDGLLPRIKTKSSLLTRSYTLTDRDAYVYVSVKRWDEDHNPINFPNGHTLWQSMFHNPRAGGFATAGSSLMQVCNGLSLPGGAQIGLGLEPQTVAGLSYANISSTDQASLASSFMLNDNINGTVDPNSNTGAYAACLNMANSYLCQGTESHACAEYIASRNASGPSGNGDSDYSIKFVNCPSIPPEDLGKSTQC